jgi:hypothetical protein
MGTRTLTMATGGSPGPWQETWYDHCNNNDIDCNCVEQSGWSCSVDNNCQGTGWPSNCRYYEFTRYRCCQWGVTCMLLGRTWTCASCTSC